ncbi:MAG TPA: sulfatase-like hydrolase/transferase, partial [Myxococcota bacterium]|nr:sulfatase-like hydrolase/transferase [Myxococcota bacterium]
ELRRLLDDLKAAGLMTNAVVLLTGDHGESLGDHDIYFNHHGLYDDVLRVPFLLWSSSPAWTPGMRVPGQASVLDVANSLLGAGGLPLMAGTRSESMGNRALGAVTTPEAALLLGREGMSLSEGQLFGVRSSNGIKYIQRSDGTEEFYDLNSDPFEKTNISSEQARGVQIGRSNVEALRRALPDPAAVDDATRAMLKELGYIE